MCRCLAARWRGRALRGTGPGRLLRQSSGKHSSGSQYAFTNDFNRWLGKQNARRRFTAALKNLAADLDTAARPVNYWHRREALRN